MRATLKAIWEWAFVALFVVLVVSAFAAPHIATEIVRWVGVPYGTFIMVRWVVRFGQHRLRAGGVRAFVPRKTPWAP